MLSLLILYFDLVVIGRRDYFYRARFTSFHTHVPVLAFFRFFVSFHS